MRLPTKGLHVHINFSFDQDKSFVDDLTIRRRTVSMRVAFVLRSIEVLRSILLISTPPPLYNLRRPKWTS